MLVVDQFESIPAAAKAGIFWATFGAVGNRALSRHG
jgi:hypothetical protein